MRAMSQKDDEDHGAPALDRRRFLSIASIAGSSAGLALVAGAVPAACGGKNEAPFGKLAAGNISALTTGAVMIIGAVAVIARDAEGVYAMTGVCTHMGCTVLANGLRCPCHGSSYNPNGVVIGGPAPSPLQHYAVTIAPDGSLTIDGDQPVSATTRTPVA